MNGTKNVCKKDNKLPHSEEVKPTAYKMQDVREYPALRKCKEDSFLKKYFKFLWVVFVLLVYLPVMVIGALVT